MSKVNPGLHSFKTKGGKSKRMRTSFTSEQLSRLEKEFARQQYMVGSERFLLASALQLSNDVSQDSLLLHGPFARKPKRIRTAFSPSQLLRLERAFEKNHYVVGAERKQLANSLSL